jgi:hypothetical protein
VGLYSNPYQDIEGLIDVREHDCKMYPIESLSTFRKFVFDIWLLEQAPKYFKGKNPVALDYIQKLLN